MGSKLWDFTPPAPLLRGYFRFSRRGALAKKYAKGWAKSSKDQSRHSNFNSNPNIAYEYYVCEDEYTHYYTGNHVVKHGSTRHNFIGAKLVVYDYE